MDYFNKDLQKSYFNGIINKMKLEYYIFKVLKY